MGRVKERKVRDGTHSGHPCCGHLPKLAWLVVYKSTPSSSDHYSPHFSDKETSCLASEWMAQGHKVSK